MVFLLERYNRLGFSGQFWTRGKQSVQSLESDVPYFNRG